MDPEMDPAQPIVLGPLPKKALQGLFKVHIDNLLLDRPLDNRNT